MSGSLVRWLIVCAALLAWPAWADEALRQDVRWGTVRDTMPVRDELYLEECGACHMAYPPGFLPQRSWQRIFDQLDDHYGENAELDGETVDRLLAYVLGHSAERSDFKYAILIMEELWDDQVPERISEVPYIKQKHAQIPQERRTSAKIRSLAGCNKCHSRAREGSFRKQEISNIWGE